MARPTATVLYLGTGTTAEDPITFPERKGATREGATHENPITLSESIDELHTQALARFACMYDSAVESDISMRTSALCDIHGHPTVTTPFVEKYRENWQATVYPTDRYLFTQASDVVERHHNIDTITQPFHDDVNYVIYKAITNAITFQEKADASVNAAMAPMPMPMANEDQDVPKANANAKSVANTDNEDQDPPQPTATEIAAANAVFKAMTENEPETEGEEDEEGEDDEDDEDDEAVAGLGCSAASCPHAMHETPSHALPQFGHRFTPDITPHLARRSEDSRLPWAAKSRRGRSAEPPSRLCRRP